MNMEVLVFQNDQILGSQLGLELRKCQGLVYTGKQNKRVINRKRTRVIDPRTRCVIQVVGGSNPDMRMDATRVHQIRCQFVDGSGADQAHSHLKLILNVIHYQYPIVCRAIGMYIP